VASKRLKKILVQSFDNREGDDVYCVRLRPKKLDTAIPPMAEET